MRRTGQEVPQGRSGRATISSMWCGRLLEDVAENGAGRRYLIQHSAGSGKSNSIAWLTHQLIGLSSEGAPVFDTIIVITDRRILDRQINDTIKTVRPGRGHRWPCQTIRATCAASSSPARRSSSRRCRSSRSSSTRSARRAARPALRHHHRRGPFQPGRAHQRGDDAGAVRSRRGG